MALVIKKPVDLSSIGEEYKGISLVFKSIPAKDLPGLEEKQKTIGEETAKVLPLFIEILQTYFLEGKQGEENIVKEDLGSLDSEALIYCFQVLTGQTLDPKASSESESESPTSGEDAQK